MLIDRFHVLTCGHGIYNHASGGAAAKVEVIPSSSGKERPFGAARVTRMRTYKRFLEFNRQKPRKTGDDATDIALLTLDQTIGDRTGWMPFGPAPEATFAEGTVFNLAGYPAQNGYDGQRMYYCYGPIKGLSGSGRSINYERTSLISIPGMSGGPVWRFDGKSNNRIVHGINIAGPSDQFGGSAIRITRAIFEDMQKWRMSDQVPGKIARSTVALDLGLRTSDLDQASAPAAVLHVSH